SQVHRGAAVLQWPGNDAPALADVIVFCAPTMDVVQIPSVLDLPGPVAVGRITHLDCVNPKRTIERCAWISIVGMKIFVMPRSWREPEFRSAPVLGRSSIEKSRLVREIACVRIFGRCCARGRAHSAAG